MYIYIYIYIYIYVCIERCTHVSSNILNIKGPSQKAKLTGGIISRLSQHTAGRTCSVQAPCIRVPGEGRVVVVDVVSLSMRTMYVCILHVLCIRTDTHTSLRHRMRHPYTAMTDPQYHGRIQSCATSLHYIKHQTPCIAVHYCLHLYNTDIL